MGHHPRRHRCVRPRVTGACRTSLGRGPVRRSVHRDRGAGPRRRRQPDRHHAPGRPATRVCATRIWRSSPSLKPVGRENGVHTAGNSSQISDGAAAVLMMTADEGGRARADPARPHRRHLPRRRRPGADVDRADRRDRPPARPQRPHDRRHRQLRDQRGVRVGRARVAEGTRRRPGRRRTRTAARSRSATRSVAPAPSC